MASRIFALALSAAEKGTFPRTRKWAWRGLYNLLSRFAPHTNWRYMNYGYVPEGTPFPLRPEDEADRPFIGLYHQAVSGLEIRGKRVLEVGSGRGGGASYIARCFEPASMIGLDYSPATVDRARRLVGDVENLEFRIGDAEDLPFEDGSFDVVVNIESSHCYNDMSRFVAEVERVLKPGGCFTWADLRTPSMIEALDRAFEHPHLILEDEGSLAEGVVRALDMTHDFRHGLIRKVPVIRGFLREFAGLRGSTVYTKLKSGEGLYLRRLYRKTPAVNEA